jgi:hypothetical protein
MTEQQQQAVNTFRVLYPWLTNDANLSLLTGSTIEELVAQAKSIPGIEVLPEYRYLPEYSNMAARQFALERTLALYLASERKNLLQALGSDPKYANATNVELRVYVNANSERARLKAEITGDQSMFSKRVNGIAQRYDSATGQRIIGYDSQQRPKLESKENWFAVVDLETLRIVHAEIMQERGWRAGSSEDIRESLTGKKRVADDGSPFRVAHFAQPTPKPQTSTTPVEELTSDGFQLINPATLREFSKHELLVFLNVPRNASKILTHPDSKQILPKAIARMREILQGRS